jgi:uncharacterized membrane protein
MKPLEIARYARWVATEKMRHGPGVHRLLKLIVLLLAHALADAGKRRAQDTAEEDQDSVALAAVRVWLDAAPDLVLDIAV